MAVSTLDALIEVDRSTTKTNDKDFQLHVFLLYVIAMIMSPATFKVWMGWRRWRLPIESINVHVDWQHRDRKKYFNFCCWLAFHRKMAKEGEREEVSWLATLEETRRVIDKKRLEEEERERWDSTWLASLFSQLLITRKCDSALIRTNLIWFF